MSNSIKSVLILSIICLGLGTGLVALAQEGSVLDEVILDEVVSAEDLETSEPSLLPDSRFYFLKNWGRTIQTFFAFNSIKKLELKEKFSNEKLMELKKTIKEGKSSEKINKAAENYQKGIEKVRAAAGKIKEKTSENTRLNSFLDKFIRHQLLHQKILQKLETQVKPEVFEKINKAREKHLERFGEVMAKLEDRKEKIREKLEKNMEEIKGSKYKNFKNLEILMELEEKVPEFAKEAILKAQENTLKRLQENLEKMSPEDQEKFKEYIDKISGDKEKQLEILENLRQEIKRAPETQEILELKETLKEGRAGIIEKVREKVREIICPKIESPVPGFCEKGRIIVKKDNRGCVVSFKCIIAGEAEIIKAKPIISKEPELEKPEIVCVSLWDPVCGKDGKTYSNKCWAKAAGIEIAYKGICKEKNVILKIQNAPTE